MPYAHYISHSRAREHLTASLHILKELNLAVEEMLESEIRTSRSKIVHNGLRGCREFISREKASRRDQLHHLGSGVRRSDIEKMQVVDNTLKEGVAMVEHAFLAAHNSPINSCFHKVLWDSTVSLLKAFRRQISELEMGEEDYHNISEQLESYTPPAPQPTRSNRNRYRTQAAAQVDNGTLWRIPPSANNARRATASQALLDTSPGGFEDFPVEDPVPASVSRAIQTQSSIDYIESNTLVNELTTGSKESGSGEMEDVEMLDINDVLPESSPWPHPTEYGHSPPPEMPGAFPALSESPVPVTNDSINMFLAMNEQARAGLDPAVLKAHHEAIQTLMDRQNP